MTANETTGQPSTTSIPSSGVLTNSSEQCFMACPRLYYWTYEKGWRPGKTRKPLRFGSVGHAGIDTLAHHKNAPIEAAINVATVAIQSIYDEHIATAADWPDAQQAQHDLALECVTVQCLVHGYAYAWSSASLEIIESEKTFSLPIINPETGSASRTFTQAGKRDRIAKLDDGRLALMETKFVSDDLADDSDYWRMLSINQQLSKYILAARADGIDVQTTIQDVIRKPTIKPCDQPELDEHGLVVVRDATGQRVKKKDGHWRLTADEDKGFTIRKYPMTADQWRAKLSADISADPAKYFARREIPRLDSDLDEYRHELWYIADAIRLCRNSGRWFRNSGSCKRFNSLCPYYPLCAGIISTTNGIPEGFRLAESCHEELSSIGEGAAL